VYRVASSSCSGEGETSESGDEDREVRREPHDSGRVVPCGGVEWLLEVIVRKGNVQNKKGVGVCCVG
jgi:hypothetical protein